MIINYLNPKYVYISKKHLFPDFEIGKATNESV